MNLRDSDRAKLRDWYDTSGPWKMKMPALYRLVESIVDKYVAEAKAELWDSIDGEAEPFAPNPHLADDKDGEFQRGAWAIRDRMGIGGRP